MTNPAESSIEEPRTGTIVVPIHGHEVFEGKYRPLAARLEVDLPVVVGSASPLAIKGRVDAYAAMDDLWVQWAGREGGFRVADLNVRMDGTTIKRQVLERHPFNLNQAPVFDSEVLIVEDPLRYPMLAKQVLRVQGMVGDLMVRDGILMRRNNGPLIRAKRATGVRSIALQYMSASAAPDHTPMARVAFSALDANAVVETFARNYAEVRLDGTPPKIVTLEGWSQDRIRRRIALRGLREIVERLRSASYGRTMSQLGRRMVSAYRKSEGLEGGEAEALLTSASDLLQGMPEDVLDNRRNAWAAAIDFIETIVLDRSLAVDELSEFTMP